MGLGAPPPTGLPVEEVVDEVRAALAHGTAVLQAAPGAGKTTVVPLRLLDEPWLDGGTIVMLEPRRVAARAAATRMASLLGEEVGATVGYVTRDDRRVGPRTRIQVVTEGILTRRLQSDPSLPGTALVIFDEWHERHLQGDLGLALTLDARDGLRPDLRVLVMSATLAADPVAVLLGGAPIVRSAGRTHPVTVRWAPHPVAAPAHGRGGAVVTAVVASAVRKALQGDRAGEGAGDGAGDGGGDGGGDVLVFLPGVGELRSVAASLGGVEGVDVLVLHGGMPAGEQDAVLRSGPRRRVVLATDLAESSVTVAGVRTVVDAGLARRPSYDPGSGLSRLRTVIASRASADQRAGRAGRLGPGTVHRLWSEAEHAGRRQWPDPEIVVADLAPLVLELAIWGAPAGALRWLDPPPEAALAAAAMLLEQLGALVDGRPTELGRRVAAVALHPRLATMLLGAAPAQRSTAGLLAALLSERDVIARGAAGTTDVAERLAAVTARGDGAPRPGVDRAAVSVVRRRAGELGRRAGPGAGSGSGAGSGTGSGAGRGAASRAGGGGSLGRAADRGEPGPGSADPGPLLAAAYPDRIAQSRGGGRYRLRTGGGASMSELDPLARAPWIVAAEVDGALGGPGRADARLRLAAEIDRADIERLAGHLTRTVVRFEWDDGGELRAVTERRVDDLVLGSTRGAPEPGPATTAALVARAVDEGLSILAWTQASLVLQARAGWARSALGDAWPDVSDAALAASAGGWLVAALEGATGRAALRRVDPGSAIRSALGGLAHDLDRLVPVAVRLAGGRTARVDYHGERPRISVRAQDLFGTRAHPTVAAGRVPLTVEVLSPAGRPIQVTADLPGFWAGSWQQVRREMAGRYPKHDWPVDPGVAGPAARPGGARVARRQTGTDR